MLTKPRSDMLTHDPATGPEVDASAHLNAVDSAVLNLQTDVGTAQTDITTLQANNDLAVAVIDHGSVVAATAVPVDLSLALTHAVEPQGDFTLNITNWPTGSVATTVEIVITNGSVATNSPLAGFNWGNAGVPALSMAGRDRLILRSDDNGTTIDAVVAGLGF